MVDADDVRRDFVANLTHELRTPIGAIALLAETMIAETEVPALLRLAERVHSEALRVSRTIDDLLLLSRIENEDSPVRERIAVAALLAEAADGAAAAAASRHVRLCCQVADDTVHVDADRRQLLAAIGNLLDNAVRYSPREGVVVLRTRPLERGELHIEVEDQGIGIPEGDLDRVFERLYRVDPARSRRTGGSGLGLAIVRHVAENHGGRIAVRSSEGRGSTFVLTVPVGTARAGTGAGGRPGDVPEAG